MSSLDSARQIGAAAALRSREIEDTRRLPDDIAAELRDAQLLRLYVPAVYDGPGGSVMEGLRVIEELAYHDGSVGWCAGIAMTSAAMASYLPPRFAKEIYGERRAMTGGFAAPLGRAVAVDGGLRVSGTWQWGSGTHHCSWIGGGCRLVGADGRTRAREDGLAFPFVFFDKADVHLLDNWDAGGLRGSGSTDYEVTDAFVPEGRWVQIGFDPPTDDGPLGRFSFYGLLALGIAAVGVGLARRSLDELVALAETKRPQGSSKPLRERSPIQADVAIAEARVRSVWGLVTDAVEDAWASAASGTDPSDEQRRLLRLAATHATAESASATELMYRAGGGAAVYADHPLQRVFRDANVVTQHAMVTARTYELTGRMRLGLETDTRQL